MVPSNYAMLYYTILYYAIHERHSSLDYRIIFKKYTDLIIV